MSYLSSCVVHVGPSKVIANGERTLLLLTELFSVLRHSHVTLLSYTISLSDVLQGCDHLSAGVSLLRIGLPVYWC